MKIVLNSKTTEIIKRFFFTLRKMANITKHTDKDLSQTP